MRWSAPTPVGFWRGWPWPCPSVKNATTATTATSTPPPRARTRPLGRAAPCPRRRGRRAAARPGRAIVVPSRPPGWNSGNPVPVPGPAAPHGSSRRVPACASGHRRRAAWPAGLAGPRVHAHRCAPARLVLFRAGRPGAAGDGRLVRAAAPGGRGAVRPRVRADAPGRDRLAPGLLLRLRTAGLGTGLRPRVGVRRRPAPHAPCVTPRAGGMSVSPDAGPRPRNVFSPRAPRAGDRVAAPGLARRLVGGQDGVRERQPQLLLDRLQPADQLHRRLRAGGRVLGHRLAQQPLQAVGDVGPLRARRRVRLDPPHQRERAVVAARLLERRPADEQVPQRGAERVDVGALVARPRSRRGSPAATTARTGPLGRRRPSSSAMPKSVSAGLAVGVGQDVLRLDVAVQDVAAVAGLDRAADLDADAQHVRDGEVRAARPHRQVRLRVVRHHDVRAAVRGHVGVEDLDDVPVGQVRRDVRLGGEPAAGRLRQARTR